MNRISTFLAALVITSAAFAQTTVYETGGTVSDPWTGWSTPVTVSCSGTVNGGNNYVPAPTAGL